MTLRPISYCLFKAVRSVRFTALTLHGTRSFPALTSSLLVSHFPHLHIQPDRADKFKGRSAIIVDPSVFKPGHAVRYAEKLEKILTFESVNYVRGKLGLAPLPGSGGVSSTWTPPANLKLTQGVPSGSRV